jgi:tetratricopeptide (TPR) repeat protein
MRIATVMAAVAVLHTSALAAPSAETLFDEGQAAYDQGDYRRAIDRWQKSYRLSKEPALLYNIALAYSSADDCEHALSTYKQFIALDPTSEQRSLAEESARGLDAKCVSPAEPQAEDTDGGRNLRLAGLVTGGAGAALVVTGLLFGRRASTLGDEVTDACSDPTDPCDWDMQKDKDATGRRYSAIGYTLDVVGVVAVAGGALVYFLGDRKSSVTVSPTPRDGGAVLSLGGHW